MAKQPVGDSSESTANFNVTEFKSALNLNKDQTDQKQKDEKPVVGYSSEREANFNLTEFQSGLNMSQNSGKKLVSFAIC